MEFSYSWKQLSTTDSATEVKQKLHSLNLQIRLPGYFSYGLGIRLYDIHPLQEYKQHILLLYLLIAARVVEAQISSGRADRVRLMVWCLCRSTLEANQNSLCMRRIEIHVNNMGKSKSHLVGHNTCIHELKNCKAAKVRHILIYRRASLPYL